VIPSELVDLVEHEAEQTRVQLVFRKVTTTDVETRIKIIGEKIRHFADLQAFQKRVHSRAEKEWAEKGLTASEMLAFLLRIHLRELKHAEGSRKAAPVRTLNLMPRSLIAEIAMDLLERCDAWEYPPGPFLLSLFHELLNLERDKKDISRQLETKKHAAAIVAQMPEIGTRELAAMLGINAGTVSRWRNSPEFERMVVSFEAALRLASSQSIGGRPVRQHVKARSEANEFLDKVPTDVRTERQIAEDNDGDHTDSI
jgi:hypothetical protein